MAVMSPVLAVVHRGSASAAELSATLSSLVGQVSAVQLVATTPDDVGTAPADDALLPASVERLVRSSVHPDAVERVLVVPAGVVLARGAVARLTARAAAPGRVVTRVLVPGLAAERPLALWRGDWVRGAGLDAGSIATAGVELDRERLDHGDPRVRSWVPADEVGAALVPQTGPSLARWSWRTGARLSVRSRVAVVRSRLGQLRRSRALGKQRRAVDAR